MAVSQTPAPAPPDLSTFLQVARPVDEASAADDSFHPVVVDDPYWTETAWFGFHVPERKLSGWIYPFFRPNLGLCACLIQVWDETGESFHDARYASSQWHMPMPDHDLTHLRLPNGLCYDQLEPLRRYGIAYESGDFGVELEFRGLEAPRLIAADGQGHIDQVGRVTGHLTLDGERIEVDCLGARDRSWSVRDDTKGDVCASYCCLVDSPDHSLISWGMDSTAAITSGHYVRDGVGAPVVSGQRTVEYAAGRPVRVHLEITDALGRDTTAAGEIVNRSALHLSPKFFEWVSLCRWTFDGSVVWGEDQQAWSLDQYRSARRRGLAASAEPLGS